MIESPESPKVYDYGLFAEHNQICHVCWKQSAVLRLEDYVFLPCWACQEEGWTLVKKFRWRRARRG